MRFLLCENKGADQLCSNCTADQGRCFRYINGTIPLLKFQAFSHLLDCIVCVGPRQKPQSLDLLCCSSNIFELPHLDVQALFMQENLLI